LSAEQSWTPTSHPGRKKNPRRIRHEEQYWNKVVQPTGKLQVFRVLKKYKGWTHGISMHKVNIWHGDKVKIDMGKDYPNDGHATDAVKTIDHIWIRFRLHNAKESSGIGSN